MESNKKVIWKEWCISIWCLFITLPQPSSLPPESPKSRKSRIPADDSTYQIAGVAAANEIVFHLMPSDAHHKYTCHGCHSTTITQNGDECYWQQRPIIISTPATTLPLQETSTQWCKGLQSYSLPHLIQCYTAISGNIYVDTRTYMIKSISNQYKTYLKTDR